jgi:hypothetical protein
MFLYFETPRSGVGECVRPGEVPGGDDDIFYLFLQEKKMGADELHMPLGRHVP